MDIKVLCECNSWTCDKSITLPLEQCTKDREGGNIIIVSDCEAGPDPTDVLVEEKDGYSIYKEQK